MYPEMRPTSRTSSAAGSSCSTTSRARSSARPASSAPRPARSSASTWAAWTPRAASTSTGARPRRTASGARNRRCAAPAGRSRTRPTSTSRRSTSPRSTRSSSATTTTPSDMLEILEATQAAYGYLPVAALKRISERTGAWYAMIYGTATYYAPPALRAADAPRPRRRRSRAHRPAEATYLAALDAALGAAAERPPGPALGAAPDHDRPARDAGRLAVDPPRARRRQGPDGPRRGRRGRRVRGPAPRRPRARARRRRSPRSRERAARPRRRRPPGRATSGGPRPRRRRAAGTSSRTATARTRRRTPTGRSSSATRTRSSRASAIAAFAIGADRGVHRGPRRGHRRHRRAWRRRSARPTDAGFIGEDVLGSGPRHRDRGPAGPGRVHARRGDGPAQGPRGQARPARAAAAAPRRARPVRHADGRPERADPGRRALDPARGRGGVRGDRHRRAPGTILVEVRDPGRRAASPRSRSGRRSRDVIGARRQAAGKGRSLKAVVVGGPTGGLLPPDALDTPYTFDGLRAVGAHVGSGSVIVVDDRADLVELVGVLTRFCSPTRRAARPSRAGSASGAWPRSSSAARPATLRPTDAQLADGPRRRHRRPRRCATTSAWRRCR